VVAESEDRFPAGDRIGAHDGVDSFEDFADVFWGAARLRVDLEAIPSGCLVESWLSVGCGEGFKELLDRG